MPSSDHASLRQGLVGQLFHLCYQRKAGGVMIRIRKSVPFVAPQTISDPKQRYVIVVRKLNYTPVILACVYAPNRDDPKFFFIFTLFRYSSADSIWGF